MEKYKAIKYSGRQVGKIHLLSKFIADFNSKNRPVIDLDPVVKLATQIPEEEFIKHYHSVMDKIRDANIVGFMYNEKTRMLEGIERQYVPGTNIEVRVEDWVMPGKMHLVDKNSII
jgi:hypothetical protein